MKRRTPSVALVWVYRGKDASARQAEIEGFDYPDFRIVNGAKDIPPETDLCIFWVDDDKPVTRNFIHEMTKPLIAGKDFRAVMHFWSGNAISMPKALLDDISVDDCSSVNSLLKLMMPLLDATNKGPSGRVHIAFSSTERLAPLSMEPVGFPS